MCGAKDARGKTHEYVFFLKKGKIKKLRKVNESLEKRKR